MPQNSVPYAISRTRVLENRLLNRERLQRILEVHSAADMPRVLLELGYGGTQQGDVQALIRRELDEAYEYVRRVTPDEYATGTLLLKGDCHNAKCILKADLLGFDAQTHVRDCGTIDPKKLLLAMSKGDVSMLSQNMKLAAQDIVSRLELGSVQVRHLECRMDNACFADMSEYAKKSGDGAAIALVQMQADLSNLLTLLRIRRSGGTKQMLEEALLPGGTVDSTGFMTALEGNAEDVLRLLGMPQYRSAILCGIERVQQDGSFGLLEKQCDDVILNYLKDRRYQRDGIAPLLGYLLAKEREAHAVRLIYICKRNGVPLPMMQERLRDLYA